MDTILYIQILKRIFIMKKSVLNYERKSIKEADMHMNKVLPITIRHSREQKHNSNSLLSIDEHKLNFLEENKKKSSFEVFEEIKNDNLYENNIKAEDEIYNQIYIPNDEIRAEENHLELTTRKLSDEKLIFESISHVSVKKNNNHDNVNISIVQNRHGEGTIPLIYRSQKDLSIINNNKLQKNITVNSSNINFLKFFTSEFIIIYNIKWIVYHFFSKLLSLILFVLVKLLKPYTLEKINKTFTSFFSSLFYVALLIITFIILVIYKKPDRKINIIYLALKNSRDVVFDFVICNLIREYY